MPYPASRGDVGASLTKQAEWIPEPSELRHFIQRADIQIVSVAGHPIYLFQARCKRRPLLNERRVRVEMHVSPYFGLASLIVILQLVPKRVVLDRKPRLQKRSIVSSLQLEWLLIALLRGPQDFGITYGGASGAHDHRARPA